MAVKTIAVSEDAYRILESLKQPGESFTDLVLRYYKGTSYTALAGAWKDVPPEEIQAFRKEIAVMRRRSDEKLSDTLKRLGW